MAVNGAPVDGLDPSIGIPTNGTDPLLKVRDLAVEIRRGDRVVRPISGLSLDLHRGETVGIVGETGSGKSMTGLSIMGMLPAGGRVTGGSIRFDGTELVHLDAASYRSIRGNRVAMVFQDSLTSLNPTRRIGDQVAEPLRLHRGATRRQALRSAIDMLGLVGLPHPDERLDDYPHQLSGGMRQRVMIAMSLICEPEIVIADEPTTALDVTIQAQILDLLDDLRARLGMSMLLVTHDMGVIAQHTDRVAVMYAGRLAEVGPTPTVFSETRHRYTEALLASIPTLEQDRGRALYSIGGAPPDLTREQVGCPFAPRCASSSDQCTTDDPPVVVEELHSYACWHPAQPGDAADQIGQLLSSREPGTVEELPRLRVTELRREYPVGTRRPFSERRTVKAVSGVSFEVAAGETFGLVGESGCGKSSLGRLLVALDRPTGGEVEFDGQPMTQMSGRGLSRRRAQLQMMFQDSQAALDPRMRIGSIVAEPLVIQGVGSRAERAGRVRDLLADVGLPASIVERFPHELSGGQRQRIGLARALALDPLVLVADEPVSALDASVRSQVLNLMRRIQRERGLSSIVISHDLSVIRYLADRVGVMYLGKLVEIGAVPDVYAAPAHPYTAGLIAAVPTPDPEVAVPREAQVRGDLPSPIDPPSGCRFRTRCPLATDLCAEVEPPLNVVAGTHQVACHHPLQATQPVEGAVK